MHTQERVNKRFEKMARELGREQAMEKLAVIGALRGLYRGARALTTGTMGRAGKALTTSVAKQHPQAAKWLARIGKGATNPMWQFGMFGGGMGALLNPEDRFGGFARGFAGGALGGLGWQAGSNLTRYGLKKGLSKIPGGTKFLQSTHRRKLFRPLTTAQKALKKKKPPGLWARRTFLTENGMTGAQAAKLFGTKAALGAPLFAGGLIGSEMMPTFGGGGQQQVPQYYQVPQQGYYQ